MTSSIKNDDHLRKNELIELIGSYFPKLDQENISSIIVNFEVLSVNELRIVLNQGIKIAKKGRRILLTYLRVAPTVYVLTGDKKFDNWTQLSEKVSQLNIFCLEGFLESTPSVLKNGDIGLLEKWTDIGIDLAKSNKSIAIAYFKNSVEVLIKNRPERFEELTDIGKELAVSNVQVAESYFENLSGLGDVLSYEELKVFYLIIEKILRDNWATAVEILEKSKEVFSSVPANSKEILLMSMNMILGYGSTPALALFRNAPRLMMLLDQRSFHEWTCIACNIAKTNIDASISFLDQGLEVLDVIEVKEIEGWITRFIEVFGLNGYALEQFIHCSFQGLARYKSTTQKEERSYFLDIGARLALINPDNLEAYFAHAPEVFDLLTENRFNDWISIGEEIARNSSVFASAYYRNSVIIFNRLPVNACGEILTTAHILLEKDWLLAGMFIDKLPIAIEKLETPEIRKWAGIGVKIYERDKRFAVDYFTYSPQLLSELDIGELEEWALNGILISEDNHLGGRPYFSLRSKISKEFVAELTGSVALKKVSKILHYYGLGLSGVNFTIRSKKFLPMADRAASINPVVDGKTIYLAPKMSIYSNQENNFKIYKLSIMHEVGHIKHSSMQVSLNESSGLLKRISGRYPKEKYGTIDPCLENRIQLYGMETIGIPEVLGLFPNPAIAGTILGILEDARIEYMIMDQYRGVRLELERIRYEMLSSRPVPEGDIEKIMDLLLWLSTDHEPDPQYFKIDENILHRIREIIHDWVFKARSTVLDALKAAFQIYELVDDHLGPLEIREWKMFKNIDYRGVSISACSSGSSDSKDTKTLIRNFIPEKDDVKEEEKKRIPEHIDEKEEKKVTYALDKNWKILGTYRYDEWDFVINDYKSDWCTVSEIEPVGGTSGYYDITTEHYRNEIALIKRIFSIMKPVDFQKLKQQIDGSEIDIDSFIDSLMEKKCGINPDDRLYVRWEKQKRDVATLFLVDVSASTRKTLGEEKRSIIDVEKDALIIMTHALESIGDKYAINAFSGHNRDGVEYFVVKGFEEEMSADIARRISILEPVSNTRLGSAIRHSISKLEEVKAKTKIIILLSDGEPYDTCKGESAYQGRFAEEDTRIAIQEVNAKGMHLFCITVDSSPGDYLENIFSDVGYTIMDDARKLPETLPLLYKKITT
ncbi:MAG: VWA domain-containing protein [Methanolobus sp.]|nr:VWA domain-containing protein [Methanolobus sp.]